ncbi:hypothetical protein OS175_08275 [Marinicella sp. S1101]|uniref:hypothetical protein n=1 Tax=Marinicella marina TaxID=2996016 RepID=UPI002260BFA0|nr:hypothetical protein [Marinicella marina]MCX7553872.1 hypothetical protein [Marinicella marina]MDJ1140364.1 hypothetical protein [Marinicella marina]
MNTLKSMLCLSTLILMTAAMAAEDSVEGVLIFEYGDTFDATQAPHQNFYLQTEKAIIKLDASAAFKSRLPIDAWSGKRVSVKFKNQLATNLGRSIQAIELIEGEAMRGGGISGPQKWVSFLCKFNDVATEPENEAYFDNMYANTPAGLDHYWREVSYNNANVAGSVAFDWVDLPGTHTSYVPTPGSGTDADLNLLFDDCTDTAISTYGGLDINDDFVGINMMFNESLDCCAWGGGRYTSLDGGPSKLWRVTWNPPWAFRSIGVIAHEMGHGFGLPHANNSDGDSNPYDSPWDVMSSATGYAVNDGVYGRLGKHINMEFKQRLEWVTDGDGFIADENTDNEEVFINYSSRPTTMVNGVRFARIPASNNTYYMVEVRKAEGNYESNIVDTAVIIHNVANCRSEPPWVVDGDTPAADYADTEGVLWRTGEVFVDPIDDFSVTILNEFENGFTVNLSASQDLINRSTFENTGCL